MSIMTKPFKRLANLKSMRSPINMILTGMAICDSIVLFSNLIFTTHWSFAAYSNCSPHNWSYGWAMFFISHAQLSLVAHTSSVYLSVAMAFLRYRTLKNRTDMNAHQVTIFSAILCIGGVILFVFFANLPNMFTYKIVEMPLSSFCNVTESFTNATAFVPGISDIALKEGCAVFRMAFWISGVVFKVIPCALLGYFMFKLIRILNDIKRCRNLLMKKPTAELAPPSARIGSPSTDHRDSSFSMNGNNLVRNGSQKHSHRRHHKSNAVNGRTDRTTRMLIVIFAAFLFAELPQGIMAVMSGMFSENFRTNVYNSFGDIIDLLSLLNAFSSFFIYCIMSEKFRMEFARVCIPNCLRQINWTWVRVYIYNPVASCFNCVKSTVKPQSYVMGSENSIRKLSQTEIERNGHRLSAPCVEYNSGSSNTSSQTAEVADECEHLLGTGHHGGNSVTPTPSITQEY
uniref:G_PROTEIN_RECEP_F1_2 domain-containing protein n=1 Tax=Panagrellus redivivus TaxID=6233 RepID=A0A7E4VQ59_PANRE